MVCWDYALLGLFPANAAYFWGRRWRGRQLAAERWGVSGLGAACRSMTQTGSGRRSGPVPGNVTQPSSYLTAPCKSTCAFQVGSLCSQMGWIVSLKRSAEVLIPIMCD